LPDIAELARTAPAQRILRANVRCSNANGVLAALAANMVAPFLGIYALRLGASNLQIGLMSSLPAMFSLACAIPGGRVLDRVEHKQRAAFLTAATARMFFLLYAVAPLLGEGRQVWFLVAAVALTNLPATLAGVAWQSLVAEAFGPRARARALAMRMRLVSLAAIGPLLLTGRLLDLMRFPLGYQVVFAVAFAIGLLEARLLLRLVELPDDAMPQAGALGTSLVRTGRPTGLRDILGDGQFVRFEQAVLVLYLGWGMGGPLFIRYRVSVMGVNNTWLSVYAVAESLAAVAAVVYWARLAEQRGNRTFLGWLAAGIAGNVWLLALVVQLPLGIVPSLWTGVFNSGTNLLLFNALLELAPSGRRATYLAYHTTVINVAQLLGPLLAVLVMDSWGVRAGLVVSGILRVIGGYMLHRTTVRRPVVVAEAGGA